MVSTRLLPALLVVALTVPAVTASAEMTFEPDEVQDQPDDQADDDEMTFAPDDLEEDDFDPHEEMDEDIDVGVVAVPGDDITDDERDQVQDALREAADEVPEITTYGDTDLLPRLVERDPAYCSREALCLAGVGSDAGVERIVQARVEHDDGADTLRLDIDYFDVDDRLFVAYHSNAGLSDLDEVLEAVGPGVDDIFGIRRDVDDDIYFDDRDVNIQSIVGYTSSGLAVASLVTGIIFGARASGQESDLEQLRNEDGEFPETTHAEVRSQQRSMENSAVTANVFYGLAVGFGALGAGMFLLGGGDDAGQADADAGELPWYRAVEWTPRIDGDGIGVGTRLQF